MQLKIPRARGAFLQLFKAKQVNGEGEPAFSGSFIIGKTDPIVKVINATIDAAAKEKWADKAPALLKQLRSADKVFLHDGDLKENYEGFPGNFFISARNKSRPVVKDRNANPLTEADGKPYSGCFIGVIVDVWCQDNKFGKRVNATLQGVQFIEDGDAFSGAPPLADDAFDDLGEGADAAPLA